MLYILSWFIILLCFFITLIAIGTWYSIKYPESKFQTWWKENVIDKAKDDYDI